MNKSNKWWLATAVTVAMGFGLTACAEVAEEVPEPAADAPANAVAGESGGPEAIAETTPAEGPAGREEGEGEHGEGGGGEEGEESGEMVARTATWDKVRGGARLVPSFNAERNAFVGTVTNTTGQTLCASRVEVHLQDGPELGPSERRDIPAGGTITIALSAGGAIVGNWTAHPETSVCGGGR